MDDGAASDMGENVDLLAAASAALASGPLCDHCLGRLVADRSFGLGNDERGLALRTVRALAEDEPFDPADGEACWVCEGEFTRLDEFAERALAGLEGYGFASYQVGTRVPPLLEENDTLLRAEAGLPEDAGEPMNREFNRELGKRLGAALDAEVDLERPDVLVVLDLATDDVETQVNSAFLYGRYRKLEREIPQTKWPCSDCGTTGLRRGIECEACEGTGYRYGTSVEQLTTPPVLEAMDGEEAVFHGAGREDVDALMLGTGRPFVIEIKEPRRRDVDTDALEAEVNEFAGGRVEVEGLRRATHEMVERVKRLDADKTYRATVAFDAPVEAEAFRTALAELEGATVDQRTPHRVDQRRADVVRQRTVLSASGELTGDGDSGREATVELRGEGGLYVKELVSGDEGRTEPSLAGLLGVDAEVTALDVLAVEGRESFDDPEYLLE
jgi:tRNA pseudouridine synthase 10